MSIYDIPIQRLEPIIEYWFDKEELFKHLETPSLGLCYNLFHGLSLSSYKCIEDYLEFCKVSLNECNIYYPIEGSKYLYNQASKRKLLYNNPKRLHLAVYMLSWLRQHNV